MNRRLVLAVVSLLLGVSHASAQVTWERTTWRSVCVGGGGFVTGIVVHPEWPDVIYARTDMGGGYRLNPETRTWVPLTDFFTDYAQMGVDAIALDARDAQRVFFACGTEAADWAPKGILLRSSNQGATWEQLPLPFKLAANWDGRSIGERMALDPNQGQVLYYGTRLDGLWRSADAGGQWEQVTSFPVLSLSANPDVRGKNAGIGFVMFDPRSGEADQLTRTIYVGLAAAGTKPLWRSEDAGATWAPVAGQPEGLIPHHAALDPDGMLFVSYCDGLGPNGVSNGAVWRLGTDSGAWTDVTPVKPGANGQPGFGYAGLSVDPNNAGVAVVSSLDRWNGGDELWRTTDGGATWRAFGQAGVREAASAPYLGTRSVGHWIGDVEIDPFEAGRLLYISGNGVFGSDDADGALVHFTPRVAGLEQTVVRDLISPPTGAHLLSAMADVGGFRHDDLNVSPAAGNFDNPRVKATNCLDFAALAPQFVVRTGETAWDGRGPFSAWSGDGGATWTPLAAPAGATKPSGSCLAVTADGAAIILVSEGLAPQLTRDRGATWQACGGLAAGVDWVVTDRVDPQRCTAVGKAQVYRSEDGGATFTAGAALTGVTRLGRMRAVPGLAGHLWLPAYDQGLLRSTDGGATFVRVGGLTRCEAVGFGRAAPGRDTPAVYVTGTGDGFAGVFRSDDDGKLWVRLNDEQHRYGNLGFAITGDPRVYGRVYVGTNGRGIVRGDPAGR